MSHPTLHIIAFSPARVNAAGDCYLPVNSAPPAAAIGGPLALMRSLAESILAALPDDGQDKYRAGSSAAAKAARLIPAGQQAVTGSQQRHTAPVPAPKARKPGSGFHRRLTPERCAKYERIAARVAAGEATWKQAALDEGVPPASAYNWNFLRRAKARLPGGPARTNAGPVATGNGTPQEARA